MYKAKNKIRILTAGSLFDGHDVTINIMRRFMQRAGAEVIHLGHNRSAHEIVNAAIEEDVQGMAITSYQGGHIDFFKYIYDLLKEQGCEYIKIFGGGGGTILPKEIEELHNYGITRLYSPDDGRKMGLEGMINDLLSACDYGFEKQSLTHLDHTLKKDLSRLISLSENAYNDNKSWFNGLQEKVKDLKIPVLGLTGTGGSGKSSLLDELIMRYLNEFQDKRLAIISVDPSKRKTGGALLGDRIRMNALNDKRVFMRSLATRRSNLSLPQHIDSTINILKIAAFDLIIIETSGIGQADSQIVDYVDTCLYVMTSEFGAASQLEKIDMLDFADIVAINKFDKQGAFDALKDVKKQYQRNHDLWQEDLDKMPVFGTIASQFNDSGINDLYRYIIQKLFSNSKTHQKPKKDFQLRQTKFELIPPNRTRYLSEIKENIEKYNTKVLSQSEIARQLFCIQTTLETLDATHSDSLFEPLKMQFKKLEKQLKPENKQILDNWQTKKKQYQSPMFTYWVRGKKVEVSNYTYSLSNNQIPKVVLPKYKDWGEILKWSLQENVPGEFPYTAGVFPFKRKNEDPTRMFAGEGNPERTNKRFHYVSKNIEAKRLSTAFDSVTLYGEDPDRRPDIYGKVGNSGVSVCSLDDAKKLYSGFNLCHKKTSVSMTINGPAPIIAAFFMNAAIDQQCELYIKDQNLQHVVEEKLKEQYDFKDLKRPCYLGDLPKGNNSLGLMLLGLTGDQILEKPIYEQLKKTALKSVRGTVQADILKEDQAQNTCIFSTKFALKLMGDMQAYFIKKDIQNFYSVSISGYHIAEAGANPISQLAFTLSNGFTFVEYYLSRGMAIDDFAPNLSFFFSNGLDPEYAVIGRVARRIWAKTMKYLYGANKRSQKLKYHIQTSGRSLHAQEIAFNDIRTTLQALYAIYDNCNSLHTNAYDEAITTPTEESVRRAMAIQLIINKEANLSQNENPLQGAFIIEELTDLVEQAVLLEFERISQRGGVLGAMETMYQRSKIQEESLYYETLKHEGKYPIVGVNTFLSEQNTDSVVPKEVIRAEKSEKEGQIFNLKNLHQSHQHQSEKLLQSLQQTALANNNLFEILMETTKCCSLGQISDALYQVGGKYRRNM